jgi:thiol-disulfide isomerase/thioredoxin
MVRMKSVYSTILVLIFISISSLLYGQNINYIKVPDLENILKASENKLFVVNFWATWCPPCVSELPNFEKVAKEYSKEKVRFILISLDFPGQIEKQLIPFLKKNKISLDVLVMTDVDYDSWISKVDNSWEGNIPATLFFNNTKNKRYFHLGEVDETGLRKIINSNLN